MLKQTVSYINFLGASVTEDLYFHLSTVEITRLLAEYGGELEIYIQNLVSNNDTDGIIKVIENILLSSYGIRTADGNSFEKSLEIRHKFENSIAYAELFEKILTEEGAALAFAQSVGLSPNTKAKLDARQTKDQPISTGISLVQPEPIVETAEMKLERIMADPILRAKFEQS